MTHILLEPNAVISECGRYRYVLTRQVGPGTRTATFILLNPSTADANNDDPTIRRCIGFARQWGCGKLTVLNLFAVRATDPQWMKAASDPVGPENKAWFEKTLADVGAGSSSAAGACMAAPSTRTSPCWAGSTSSASGPSPSA